MNQVRNYLWELFHIFFRHYNFPCDLGLMRIGNPDQNSPVFLSGNYTLVVQRLLRVLKKTGIDCYLLIANSRGSNVWCATGMNEYSEHDIVDAINVAELQEVVKHRKLIAPPYAAPGVDVRWIKDQTGFIVKWGPTHLNDIPRYVANGFQRTNDMLQAQFGFKDRLEQALSTGLAYCLTISIGLFFWPKYVLVVMGIIYFVYLYSFCLWNFFPSEYHWRRTLTIAGSLSVLFIGFGYSQGLTGTQFMIWEAALLAVVGLYAMDACGSSTLYKATVTHWLKKGDYLSLFDPVIDPEMCTNCHQCVLVCPRDVFAAKREGVKKVVAVKPQDCIECMACVKQCYDDAIFNRSGEYKGDVKSIPNLDYLMTRDWSHLKDEDRWINHPTTIRKGLPVLQQPPPLAVGISVAEVVQ